MLEECTQKYSKRSFRKACNALLVESKPRCIICSDRNMVCEQRQKEQLDFLENIRKIKLVAHSSLKAHNVRSYSKAVRTCSDGRPATLCCTAWNEVMLSQSACDT